MATLNLGGAYNGATAYVVDDIVTSSDETFICILASTGNATSNATYWTKLAAKGTDGTDLTSTLTTQGDILYRDGSGLQRLAKPASNKFLQNTSGGVCSWESVSGGLLQMVHTEITTQPTRSAGTTYADIAGLNLTITPTSSSNKILLQFDAGAVANDSRSTSFILERDISGGATTLLGGTAASSRQAAWVRHVSQTDSNHDNGVSVSYYDTTHGTTSAITYTVQWIAQGTAWLNRGEADADGNYAYSTRTHSRLYAQEIGV
jgi:hypothetical protein